MKTQFLTVLLSVLLPLAVTSCDVHEFPDLPTKADFTLHLEFDTEMPLYKEVVQVKSRAADNPDAYDARHIVSIHRLFPDGSYDRTADSTIVFTCDDVANLDCSRKLTLREGQYNIFVWTDFVEEGTETDKFYSASEFSEIVLSDKNSYVGSCDFRDAFRGSRQSTVTVRKDEMSEPVNEVTVAMKRPLAKFKFVSTDYMVFVENMLKAEALKNKESASSGVGSPESRGVNPDDYKVLFRYEGFMPCSYNMFTDKPADSWPGVSFEGAMRPNDKGEVDLGFDYVFVNGTEAGVSVRMEVYNAEGKLVASSPVIDVPLKRGRLTIVKGEFLTSIASGGVGIAPDFDGEYNVEIK